MSRDPAITLCMRYGGPGAERDWEEGRKRTKAELNKQERKVLARNEKPGRRGLEECDPLPAGKARSRKLRNAKSRENNGAGRSRRRIIVELRDWCSPQ